LEEQTVPYTLPPLPYPQDALQPHISARTLEFHYGKHHQAYVTNLNNLTQGKPEADRSLEELIRTAPAGGLFNNAAQVWNHTFYWQSMSPKGGGAPSGDVLTAINACSGSFEKFKEAFSAAAAGQFGSGWAWLVKDSAGKISIETTANAGCPLRDGKTPLLTCDVWEHAYYLDYQNARPAYISAWWNLVNWDFVAQNLRAK
jgi:Fe-Mn family superoxide dismutase